MPIIEEERRPKSSMRQTPLGEDPEVVVQRCSSRFKRTQDSENKKLIQIIEKLKSERPAMRKQKANLIIKENEKYKDRMHSINIFNGFKKIVESERSTIFKKSRSQAIIYNSMLTFLKKREMGPTQLELCLIDAIKEFLESGSVITLETIKEIVDVLSVEEKDEIMPLLLVIKPYLEVSENDFRSIFLL